MALNSEMHLIINKSETSRTPIKEYKSNVSLNEDLSEENV